jgi:hypothetical protein
MGKHVDALNWSKSPLPLRGKKTRGRKKPMYKYDKYAIVFGLACLLWAYVG